MMIPISENSWARSLFITTLFCAGIAVITASIWVAPYFENLMISLGYGYSAVLMSWLIERFVPQLKDKRTISLAISLLLAVTLGTAHAYLWVSKYPGFDVWQGIKPILLLGVIFTAVCFYFFYMQEQKNNLQRALEHSKREKVEQEKTLIESELKQLQSQIEPHFLFNTLANVSALVDQDPAQAKHMLDKLTQLLRASMARHRVNQVSVKSEVDLIDAYLSIQKVRLGPRLDFEFIIADAVKQQLIPPYLLQPLVENAIKHGIEPSIDGGTVTIRACSDAQQCILEVIDNGLGLSLNNTASTGHGIGIQNAKSRLSALYQDRASLNISENQTGGVTATIKLPLEQPTP